MNFTAKRASAKMFTGTFCYLLEHVWGGGGHFGKSESFILACMHTHTHNDICTATHIDSVWLHRLYCSCIFSTDCCLSHAQNRNVFWQQEMETNLILWTSFFQNLEFVKRWKHEHSEEVKCRQGLSTRKHCLPRIMSLMLSTGSNGGRKENINGEKLETEK